MAFDRWNIKNYLPTYSDAECCSRIRSGLRRVCTSTIHCGRPRPVRMPCMTLVRGTVCLISLAGGSPVYWSTPRHWWRSAVRRSTATDVLVDASHRPSPTGPSTTATPRSASKTTDRRYRTNHPPQLTSTCCLALPVPQLCLCVCCTLKQLTTSKLLELRKFCSAVFNSVR